MRNTLLRMSEFYMKRGAIKMLNCEICGEETDNSMCFGGRTVGICGSRTCETELSHELSAYDAQVRDEASRDNYDRYR